MQSIERRRHRAALIETAGAILAAAQEKDRSLTTEEQREFDKCHQEADELLGQIERDELQEKRDRELTESLAEPTRGYRGSVPSRTTDTRLGQVLTHEQRFEDLVRQNSPEQREEIRLGHLLRSWLLGPAAVRDLNSAEMRALSEGTDSAGGFTVPANVSSQLIDKMRARMVCSQAGARTVSLATDSTTVARVATDPATAWVAENAQLTPVDPVFDSIVFAPENLACGPVLVSRQLLEDSVNIDDELPRILANNLAVALDAACLFGSGSSNQPTGLVNVTNVNSHSMGTNGAAVTSYNDILDAILLNETDNAGPPTAAIMAPRTANEYAQLTDQNDNPLQLPPKIAGLPFLPTTAVPIDETQGTETDASTLIVGDFSDMLLGLRGNIRLLRLMERYADYLQVGFIAYLRADVQLAHPESFAKIIGIIPPA